MARGPVPLAYIGSPITTSIVPARLPQPVLGQNLPALWAIGSTGSPAFTASAVPPRENLPMVPNGTRVPSGKISTHVFCLSSSSPLLATWRNASLGLSRLIAMGRSMAMAQPKNGTYSSSRLSTWLSGEKYWERKKVSQVLW
ncbi:hypothetical protein D3C80_1488690 [compost metagenome]